MIRAAFVMNAIPAILAVPILLTESATLIAQFLESTGGGSERVRRRADGGDETAFKAVVAHCCPSESDLPQKGPAPYTLKKNHCQPLKAIR